MVIWTHHLTSGLGKPSTLSSSIAVHPRAVSCRFTSVVSLGFIGSRWSWFILPEIWYFHICSYKTTKQHRTLLQQFGIKNLINLIEHENKVNSYSSAVVKLVLKHKNGMQEYWSACAETIFRDTLYQSTH